MFDVNLTWWMKLDENTKLTVYANGRIQLSRKGWTEPMLWTAYTNVGSLRRGIRSAQLRELTPFGETLWTLLDEADARGSAVDIARIARLALLGVAA